MCKPTVFKEKCEKRLILFPYSLFLVQFEFTDSLGVCFFLSLFYLLYFVCFLFVLIGRTPVIQLALAMDDETRDQAFSEELIHINFGNHKTS